MIRFFRSPQPAALFVIPFIVIVLWMQKGSAISIYEGSNLAPLWTTVRPFFEFLPSWMLVLLMAGIVSLTAIYLNLAFNNREVLYKKSYLPSLFYVLLASSFSEFLMVHPFHLVNLLLVRVWDKTFSLFKNERPVRAIFDSGFLLSVAVLLYLPLYPFLLLYFIALLILRPFDFREWLIAGTGIALPFFFQFVWWFPVELMERWQWINRYMTHYRMVPLAALSQKQMVLGGIIAVLLLLALIRLRANYLKNIIRTRNYQQVLILHLVAAAGVFFLAGNRAFSLLLLCALPASVFIAYYFVSSKRRWWLYEFLLWILIGAVVWNHWL